MALIIDPDEPSGWRESVEPPPGTLNGAVASHLTEGLNPQQKEAVEYRGNSLLIVAGAGSGKTRVLTHRIASLIESKEAWPSQILAITFTNKAAGEMRERVGELLGKTSNAMWISTFHSACVRILRREAATLGLSSSFTIYDSSDQRNILKSIIKSLAADSIGFTPANTQAKISKLKNELIDAETHSRNMNSSDMKERVFLDIFRTYTERLRRSGALDFDDLIAETVYLLQGFPKVAALYQRRFRHILIDEYQDTNHAQYSLIRELTKPIARNVVEELNGSGVLVDPLVDGTGQVPGASLTVVGDSDQSIYAFRGADIRNIVEFERDYPGTKVVLLEQNYRSTQNILEAANAVIGNNFDRKDKKLWTADGNGAPITGYSGYNNHDEAQFVADEIDALNAKGVPYREIAVFYRTNSQTRALEEIFIRQAVPYRLIGGTRFYERSEIKDAMAYLVAVANPLDDLAVRRILNTPKRGIGPATESAIAAHAARKNVTFREGLALAPELGFGPKVTGAIAELSDLLNEATQLLDPNRAGAETDIHQNPRGAQVSEVLAYLIERSQLVKALRGTGDPQDESRAENIEELLNQTREFDRDNPTATIIDYLTHVSLVAAADELDDATGTVSLMTLHTAKGLEYNTVFITGVEEGLLPHKISANEPGGPAEERRLFYVGITRARKQLFLSLSMSRMQFGEIDVALPSRFLKEIPEHLIDWRRPPEMGDPLGGAQRTINSRAGYGFRSRSRNEEFRGGYNDGYSYSSRPNTSSNLEFREHVGASSDVMPMKREWANSVTATTRDNGDLTLDAGDHIRHHDFGEGRVVQVTGEGAKRIAHVSFDTVGPKKLLIKIAPIEKI